VPRYLIAVGDELDSWILTSTSDDKQPKCKMSLDGDDMLLEFLRGVMAKGGRVLIEIPSSASENSDRARLAHYAEPKRSNNNK
jgi:hypothetical protein